MGYNKIIFGGKTLIDLTGDTVEESKLLKGYSAHDKSGEAIEGSCTFDSDTSDGTATTDEILSGEIAYSNGNRLVGSMPNNEAVSGTISDKDTPYMIPLGYHDGSGKVEIDPSEKEKLVPGNIREGISILGVLGTMGGKEGLKIQSKTVTPSSVEQVINPDAEYDYLSQVTVKAIPYSESSNAAGGTTVTIG